MTLKGKRYRTEWLMGLKPWEKGCMEDKTYVSSSSYHIYVVAIKKSVCVCVCVCVCMCEEHIY